MDVNKVLDELKGKVDEYDLKEIAFKAIRKEFYAQHDIYINDRHVDKYMINTISDELNKLSELMVKDFGSMDIARIFYHLVDKRNMCYPEISTDKGILTLHKGYQISNSDILYVIRYSLNGQFDKDYAAINKITEDNKLSYNTTGYEIKVNELIKVKSFKNGKILIYGLSTDQIKTITDGFKIVDEFKNKVIY
jgi:hypothetical protein